MRIKIYIACLAAAVSIALRLDADSPQRHVSGTVKDIDIVRLAPGTNAALRFNNWTGDATGSANPVNVTLTGPKSVTAVYVTATPGPTPVN